MKIKVYTKRQFEALRPIDDVLVISIRDPFEKVFVYGWTNLLKIEFHDIDPRELLDQKEVSKYILFNHGHAKLIIDAMKDHKGDVIIHCHSGTSRSTAVADFISENFGGEIEHHGRGYNPNLFVKEVLQHVLNEGK